MTTDKSYTLKEGNIDQYERGREYLAHISGLKGFACIIVMFGHFSCLYKLAENATLIDCAIWHKISWLSIFISEQFWLRLFYIISGYLASKSIIRSLPSFLLKSIVRFIRLGIPVFCASLFILALNKIFGDNTANIQSIIQNAWIIKTYKPPLTLKNAFIEPFNVILYVGRWRFNAVWWMMRDMFMGSLLVYFISMMNYWINSQGVMNILSKISVHLSTLVKTYFLFVICFITIMTYYSSNNIICSVMIGAFFGYYEKSIYKILFRKKQLLVIFLMLPSLVLFFFRYKKISISDLNHMIIYRYFFCRLFGCRNNVGYTKTSIFKNGLYRKDILQYF